VSTLTSRARTHTESPQPHIHRFPLQFDFNTNNTPRAFYTFDFASRRLPPPSGISFGFNVLFALPIESKSTLAVQLAQVIFCVSEGVRSVSTGMKLWDLTFRVDRNHVFGALQFETRDRHEKIQMEGHFYASSRISTDRTTHEVTFYREMSGSPLPDRVVSTYMRQISKTLRCVIFSVPYISFLTIAQRVDGKRPYIRMAKPGGRNVVIYQRVYVCNRTIDIFS